MPKLRQLFLHIKIPVDAADVLVTTQAGKSSLSHPVEVTKFDVSPQHKADPMETTWKSLEILNTLKKKIYSWNLVTF